MSKLKFPCHQAIPYVTEPYIQGPMQLMQSEDIHPGVPGKAAKASGEAGEVGESELVSILWRVSLHHPLVSAGRRVRRSSSYA